MLSWQNSWQNSCMLSNNVVSLYQYSGEEGHSASQRWAQSRER